MRPFPSLGFFLALAALFLMTPVRPSAADVYIIDAGGTVNASDILANPNADSVLVNPGGVLNMNVSGFNLPITMAGGRLTGGGSVDSVITAQAGTTSEVDGDIVLAGSLAGSGKLAKLQGGNTVRLTGDNSGFTGTYEASYVNTYFFNQNSGSAAARWVINGSNANLSPGNPGTQSDWTIHLGSLNGTAGTLRQDGNTNTTFSIGALNLDDAFSGTIKNYYTTARDGSNGTVSINKVGTGTLTLSGTEIFYTGSTTVSGGTLDITAATLYTNTTNPGVVTVSGAGSTLKISQLGTAFGSLANDAENIVLENGGTLEITGGYHLSDRGITLAGTGGSVLYNPTAGGWIDWHGGPDIEIPAGATFTIGGSGDISLNAPITGGGALTKIGDSTLTIGNAGNGPLSYTGVTSVLGGTLIRDSDYDYSGTFFINNGATLRFNRGVAPARSLDGITTPLFTFGDKGGTLELNSGNFHTNWVSEFIFATTSGGDADHIAKSTITGTNGLNMGGWNGGNIVFDVAEFSELLYSTNMGNGGGNTLIKKGGGLMTFTGEFKWGSGTFTNRPVTVSGGTLDIQAKGDAWGISDLKLQNGATLILDKQGTPDITAASVTETNGTLIVADTTNFTVGNSFTTTVGSVFNLSGKMSFAADKGLTVGAGSTFSPLGTAEIVGNFAMESGSTLRFDFDDEGHDLLILDTGAVTPTFDQILINIVSQPDYLEEGYEFLRVTGDDTPAYSLSYTSTGFAFESVEWMRNDGGGYSLYGFAPQDDNDVPEPATWVMLLLGGIAVILGTRASRQHEVRNR